MSKQLLSEEMQRELVERLASEMEALSSEIKEIVSEQFYNAVYWGVHDSLPHELEILDAIERGQKK